MQLTTGVNMTTMHADCSDRKKFGTCGLQGLQWARHSAAVRWTPAHLGSSIGHAIIDAHGGSVLYSGVDHQRST